MEKRIAKVNISSAGGTAAKGSKTCKVTLPTSWMEALGIHDTQRELLLSFNGEKIILEPRLSAEDFAAQKQTQGHALHKILFYDNATLCSTIYADFTDQTLAVANHITDPVKTAFGNNPLPSWQDLQAFLEERCIFDHGAGLLSNTQISRMDIEPSALISVLRAQPIDTTFTRQMNTARNLYGSQLHLPKLTALEIREILDPTLIYYPHRDRSIIADRVVDCILIRQKHL